ncbi:MAG TPA: hypothetical protein VJ553_05645 [Candidatus Paceibacterota bacterium]|nr:hypothetical protein [Candidatus Paceibacterota bacterium]
MSERKQQEAKAAPGTMPAPMPPGPLEEEWSRWLVGEWESSAVSDLPEFKEWVKGAGRVTIELGIGGQFLIMRIKGRVTKVSDEYVQYLRQTAHASQDDIERLRHLSTEQMEFRTIDPQTGAIIGYLFDSWRCVAQGTGKREGDKQIMEWQWSARGQGTSVRTTERISDDRYTVTEKYTLPDGGTMEDRVQMVRVK